MGASPDFQPRKSLEGLVIGIQDVHDEGGRNLNLRDARRELSYGPMEGGVAKW